MRFLAEASICGKDLLGLVARGSAVIAEMLRLSENIPAAVLPGAERDPQLAKYKAVLFDFRSVFRARLYGNAVGWGCI